MQPCKVPLDVYVVVPMLYLSLTWGPVERTTDRTVAEQPTPFGCTPWKQVQDWDDPKDAWTHQEMLAWAKVYAWANLYAFISDGGIP